MITVGTLHECAIQYVLQGWPSALNVFKVPTALAFSLSQIIIPLYAYTIIYSYEYSYTSTLVYTAQQGFEGEAATALGLWLHSALVSPSSELEAPGLSSASPHFTV